MAAVELSGGAMPSDPVEVLVGATEALLERDVDALPEPEIHRELEALEQVRRRSEARQCRLAEVLRRRQARRLQEAGQDPARAGRKAEQQVRRQLTNGLQWSPSEARRASQLGQQLSDSPASGAAFDSGLLPPRHAQELAATLRWLHGEQRVEAERFLQQRAQVEDAVTFGKTCRGLLARLDHEAAATAQHRRNARRTVRVSTTPDGMTAFSGQLSGMDGEVFQTAIHAFRRPDVAGQHRTAEQATADAMVDMARAALATGEAPTQHGVRPHVVVTIDYQDILAQAGIAETTWSGPVPFSEVRRLLADCGVSRLLVDTRGVPVEAGEETRNVPVGVWRGVQLRDGGCIAEGCDAPAAWCEVMHLETPYRLQGRLTLDTAALGCVHHHGLFDRGGWEITWINARPRLHPPGRPPHPDDPDPPPAPDEQAPRGDRYQPALDPDPPGPE